MIMISLGDCELEKFQMEQTKVEGRNVSFVYEFERRTRKRQLTAILHLHRHLKRRSRLQRSQRVQQQLTAAQKWKQQDPKARGPTQLVVRPNRQRPMCFLLAAQWRWLRLLKVLNPPTTLRARREQEWSRPHSVQQPK